jgi:thiol-disulfide isomerase/thioredoxin
MRRVVRTVLGFLVVSIVAASEAAPAPSFDGTWRAVLTLPGGELPFSLKIRTDAGQVAAFALNGAEEFRFDSASVEAHTIAIRNDVYESEIRAELSADGNTLTGQWTKGTKPPVPFMAARGDVRRFLPISDGEPSSGRPVSGGWAVKFGGERPQVSRGEFEQKGDRVTATFLTPVGDRGFLEGDFRGGLLRLSGFDGGRAALYVARVQADGSLVGEQWSTGPSATPWTAQRLEIAGDILPDAFSLAGITNPEGRLRFAFPDVHGKTVSHDDARFRGKVVLVNITGTWCPNCNDEAPLLRELAKRYRERGLEIVSLAYEQGADPEADKRAVERFTRHYGLEFPVLLAGISDRKAAAATLPDFTGLFAFPTNIFVDRAGHVRKIHSGFAGPGTGSNHERLVAELTGVIEELLNEPAVTAEAPVSGGAARTASVR